jgi:flagellar biosynthesis/type III secretory pathway protein FliH
MPPYISEWLFRSGPEYQKGYEEGFEDARRAAVKRIKSLMKELNALEAFATSTATTSTRSDED